MRKIDPANVQKQRDQIIQGALKCFARKGVHGTSTDDICRAAKVSSGRLYYYFKSRDALMRDLIVHAHATRDELLRNLPEAPDLIEAVINVQAASAKVIAAQGVTLEVYIELLAYSTRNAAAKMAFQEAAARVATAVTEAVQVHQRAGKIRGDIAPHVVAQFIGASVTGMSLMELSQGGGPEPALRETLATLLATTSPEKAKLSH